MHTQLHFCLLHTSHECITVVCVEVRLHQVGSEPSFSAGIPVCTLYLVVRCTVGGRKQLAKLVELLIHLYLSGFMQ